MYEGDNMQEEINIRILNGEVFSSDAHIQYERREWRKWKMKHLKKCKI